MPELPEVETVRATLAPLLTGRRLDRVDILDTRLVRPFEPLAVAAELEGERIAAVERRGKYLVFRFESGRSLLIHLRMTGSLRHARAGSLADNPHRRAVVRLDDGSDVAYRDVRRALEAGIARQGATLRDYSTPDGGRGRMQHEFKVNGRGDEPCDRCGTPIAKTRVA